MWDRKIDDRRRQLGITIESRTGGDDAGCAAFFDSDESDACADGSDAADDAA